MLLVLVSIQLIITVVLLLLRKSKESFLYVGLTLSLFLKLFGVMIFIAKKGGYSPEIMTFFFFSLDIRRYFQYIVISLGHLGYIIALGRYLFPYFYLRLAMYYAIDSNTKMYRRLEIGSTVLPALSLIAYYPQIFRNLIELTAKMQDVLVNLSYFWILIYVVLGSALLIKEWIAVRIPYLRFRFLLIVLALFSQTGLFTLFSGQDPSQVYRFYSFDYIWSKGIGYLQYAPSFQGFLVIVIVTAVSLILGMTVIVKYTQSNIKESRDEWVLNRKFSVAQTGASIFSHAMKNQLLANNILLKRMDQLLEDEELTDSGRDKLSDYIAQMRVNHAYLLDRSNELYHATKTKQMTLEVQSPKPILAEAEGLLMSKYPEAKLKVTCEAGIRILADKTYLTEALYNLLINAWESQILKGSTDRTLRMDVYSERRITVIVVQDHGVGLSSAEQKQVFDPFYSQKNSVMNWGLGLYHVRSIVRRHMGRIQIDSTVGEGTSFLLMLPRIDA